MTNQQAYAILKAIHAIATAYEVADGDSVDPRYIAIIAEIAGMAHGFMGAMEEVAAKAVAEGTGKPKAGRLEG
jgi:hypothetical protein